MVLYSSQHIFLFFLPFFHSILSAKQRMHVDCPLCRLPSYILNWPASSSAAGSAKCFGKGLNFTPWLFLDKRVDKASLCDPASGFIRHLFLPAIWVMSRLSGSKVSRRGVTDWYGSLATPPATKPQTYSARNTMCWWKVLWRRTHTYLKQKEVHIKKHSRASIQK